MLETLCCERRIDFDDSELARDLFGPQNANIALIAENPRVSTPGETPLSYAPTPKKPWAPCGQRPGPALRRCARASRCIPLDVEQALSVRLGHPRPACNAFIANNLDRPENHYPAHRHPARSTAAIRCHDLVFGIGPANGKTYLAVAMGVTFLLERRVKRLNPHPAGGGSRRKTGLFARRSGRKNHPTCAPHDALNDMLDFRVGARDVRYRGHRSGPGSLCGGEL